ncbi:hypothetical protein BDZ97DRAFT_1814442 [Flammula alnicola]|nr:hypothetical protein BDZ97DRAFT_1814442 [Flammula alnicola]
MPKSGPLRRLSVALRLTEAYLPAQVPNIPTTATSLSLFLSTSKAEYLKDIKEDRKKAAGWTVVMGNEAGDLDSIASAIAYAWIQAEVHKKPAVPLIQVERADLNLRAENLYALKLAGLSETQEELLTLTEISEFKPFPSQKFILVDHNRLGEAYTTDNRKAEVIAVVDHHEDEGLYPKADPRIISPCGSCSSHVAALCPREIPAELATLLLTAILIDTDGLKPGGKAIQLDRDSAVSIAVKSTLANSIPPLSALAPIDHPNPDGLYDSQTIKELTKTLTEKKADVSHLGAFDLLRRDYKEYNYQLSWAVKQPSIKAGLSTVPASLKSWATDGKLEQAAVKWMQQRGLTVLGVLTSFNDVKKKIVGKNIKGKHKREMAWIILQEPQLAQTQSEGLTTDVLARHLWAGVEADKGIQVKKYKKFDLERGGKLPAGSKARVFKQGNANATRKAIAPLLKNILESSAPASAPGPSEVTGKTS